MNRKTFIKTSCILCAGVLSGLTIIESCKKEDKSPQGPSVNFTLDLTDPANAALKSTGGSVASNGVIVVFNGSSYFAVAQACTHEGCNISYNKSGNKFVCPCHNGTFDTNGNVVSGPPPAPLKTYTVTLNGNILTVSGN